MHSLYRYYSALDELLYVGVSHDPMLRETQHRVAKDMKSVRYIELEWFDTEDEAKAAEQIAIRREKPLWNVAGSRNPRIPRETSKAAINAEVVKIAAATPALRSSSNGRPSSTPVTEAQAAIIIALWHTPSVRRSDVVALAGSLLGKSVPDHWVRDLVIKYVGTAQRDKPDHWSGISVDDK
jgi:predicted GIY-YIG superfamily endonuclease